MNLSTISLIICVSLFAIVAHLIIPSSLAMLAVFCPVVISLAMSMGINPAVLAIPLGFSASAALILPIDPVPLITFQYGYYKISDWFKLGSAIAVIWVLVTCTFVMCIGSWLGFYNL